MQAPNVLTEGDIEYTGSVTVGFRSGTREIRGIRITGTQHDWPPMYYLSSVPVRIPAGLVMVHNWAPQHHPARVGPNGWRIWLQSDDGRLSRCHCDWASGRRHFKPFSANDPHAAQH